MARTGIKIQVKNTTLGGVPNVNANALLIVNNPDVEDEAEMPFVNDEFFMLRSPDDLEPLGLNLPANKDLVEAVNDFYYPETGVSNVGTVLWLYGGDYVDVADATETIVTVLGLLSKTVVNGFEYRPRQIFMLETLASDPSKLLKVVDDNLAPLTAINNAVSRAWDEGFTVNVVVATAISTGLALLPDLKTANAPFVGVYILRKHPTGTATGLGLLGGYMAQLSVGTSIGDVSLPPVASALYFANGVYTPATSLSQSLAEEIGDKQYIFARTRPPKNGLWFNDGATAADPSTALSSLEAVRTLGAIVDDLRLFFTSYINSKVPVTADGDIQPAYKQVVLDNAFAKVVAPYIESGDISDARLSLVAKNNDMVGTRTWEVSLSILPAPTLRWIDGFVFYVKNLS